MSAHVASKINDLLRVRIKSGREREMTRMCKDLSSKEDDDDDDWNNTIITSV